VELADENQKPHLTRLDPRLGTDRGARQDGKTAQPGHINWGAQPTGSFSQRRSLVYPNSSGIATPAIPAALSIDVRMPDGKERRSTCDR